MITLKRFRRLEQAVRDAGFGHIIEWSENIAPPTNADEFADQAIYVICNSGLSNTVAEAVYRRCMVALQAERSAATEFGHRQKSAAIDAIWRERKGLFVRFAAAAEPMLLLAELPYIGPVTVHHLAKNFGADIAKPDVHLERLARRDKTTTLKLCRRLSRQTGYRVATIDSLLWRACALRILDSHTYETDGWKSAFRTKRA